MQDGGAWLCGKEDVVSDDRILATAVRQHNQASLVLARRTVRRRAPSTRKDVVLDCVGALDDEPFSTASDDDVVSDCRAVLIVVAPYRCVDRDAGYVMYEVVAHTVAAAGS